MVRRQAGNLSKTGSELQNYNVRLINKSIVIT